MSQHNFYTDELGIKVRVLMGWDRPLARFFMVVFDETNKENEGDEGELLYSNLEDEEAMLEDVGLEYYTALLKDRYGLTVPYEMLSEIRRDKVLNTASRDEDYGGYSGD